MQSPYMLVLAISMLACRISVAYADLVVTTSRTDTLTSPENKSEIMVQATCFDPRGNTSFRFSTNKPISDNKFNLPDTVNRNRIAPPSEHRVQQRDRDMGQTFLTGERGFKLDAIHLRLGFDTGAARAGALGARVAIQFFEVIGEPRLNDSGSPGYIGRYDRVKSPDLDDYIEGETYRSIHVTRPAVLPGEMNRGDYMKWDLTGADEIVLQPNRHYAFLLMFLDRGEERNIALANCFYGTYKPDPKNPLVGHAIRREGGVGRKEAPYFAPDLPDDFQARIKLPPGTLGFPDVDTYRDHYFALTAVPGSTFKK